MIIAAHLIVRQLPVSSMKTTFKEEIIKSTKNRRQRGHKCLTLFEPAPLQVDHPNATYVLLLFK